MAGQVEAEQSWVVDTLLVKIRKLEAEISANHTVNFQKFMSLIHALILVQYYMGSW